MEERSQPARRPSLPVLLPARSYKSRRLVYTPTGPQEHLQLTAHSLQDLTPSTHSDATSLISRAMLRAKSKPKKPVVQSDSGSDSEEVDTIAIKLERVSSQYLNQPVDPALAGTKAKGFVADLKLQKKALSDALETLEAVAADVADSLARDDEENELKDDEVPPDGTQIKNLDAEFRSLLDKVVEVDICIKALGDLRQKLGQNYPITDIGAAYSKSTAAPIAAYKGQTSRQKYMENKEYISFRNSIWENLYDGKPVPNIKKMLPIETGDDEDSDDEVEIGAQQADFKCPLTLTLLNNPMGSEICVHTFSGAAIMDYLKSGPLPCPIPGCPKTLRRADMVEDAALKRRVEAHRRREKEGRSQAQATQFQTISDDEED